MSLVHRRSELCLTSYILHKRCGWDGCTETVLREIETHILGMGRSWDEGGELSARDHNLTNKRLVMGVPPVSTVGMCRPLQLIGSICIIGVLPLPMLLTIFSNIQ